MDYLESEIMKMEYSTKKINEANQMVVELKSTIAKVRRMIATDLDEKTKIFKITKLLKDESKSQSKED